MFDPISIIVPIVFIIVIGIIIFSFGQGFVTWCILRLDSATFSEIQST